MTDSTTHTDARHTAIAELMDLLGLDRVAIEEGCAAEVAALTAEIIAEWEAEDAG